MTDPARNSGLLSGERAPDAPVTGAGGLTTRLFRLFQGPHWTLLGHGDVSAISPRRGLHLHTIGERGDILDTGGQVQSVYGLAPEQWVLIRPDGHVAAIVGTPDLAIVETYLDTVGVHAPSPAEASALARTA